MMGLGKMIGKCLEGNGSDFECPEKSKAVPISWLTCDQIESDGLSKPTGPKPEKPEKPVRTIEKFSSEMPFHPMFRPNPIFSLLMGPGCP